MKKIYLIHCWQGTPDFSWYPWIEKELKNKGYEFIIPEMPDTENPKINDWVEKLKSIIKNPDKEINFIGHSIGCQAILRYLETLPAGIKIGKLAFVAPWFELQNLEDEETESIAKPWLETKINLAKVKNHFSSLFAIFSDNDPFVPMSNKAIFERELGAKTIIEKNKGHFDDDDGANKPERILDLF